MINCVSLCVYVRTCVYVNTSGPHSCAHTLRCVLLQGGTYRVSLLSWVVAAWSSREQRGRKCKSCATALNLLSAHSPDRQLINGGRVRPHVRAHGRELINRALSVRSLKSNSLSRWPVSAKTPHYHLLEELCCELSNRQEDLATEDLAAPLISLKHKCVPSTAENQSPR